MIPDGFAKAPAWRALVILTLLCAGAAPARAQGRESPAAPFARGINISDYLAYPDSREWPLFTGGDAEVSDAELRRLAGAGFTFVRLAVEPGPFLDSAPETVEKLEARLGDFIDRAAAAGLAVLVTGFARHEMPDWNPEAILADPEGDAFERYAGFLERLAGLLGEFSGARTALELMNEPQPECFVEGGDDWTQKQKALYGRVRAAAPALTVVLTPGCWAGVDGLETLEMAGYGADTLVDVHFYEPFSFTHQGATWTLPALRSLAGLSFPAHTTDRNGARAAIARLAVARHPDDRRAQRRAVADATARLEAYLREDPDAETIARRLRAVAAWAEREGIARGRVLIGEFGTMRPVPEAGVPRDGSRERWLRATRESAEGEGFGWALWGWKGPFGLINAPGAAPPGFDAGVLRALGLETAAETNG